MEKKTNYVKGRLNCAESVIEAYNLHFNDNLPISLGSAMGGGATIGSLCGAVNAGVLILGHLFGRNSEKEENKARKICSTFIEEMEKKLGSLDCDVLLEKKAIPCSEIVEITFLELEKTIKENR